MKQGLKIFTLFLICLLAGMSVSHAQGLNFSLELIDDSDEDYQFKNETDKKIKSLLLFGDLDNEPRAYVPNERFNFGDDFEGYIRHHFETATNGLFGDPADRTVDIVAGDESFFSRGLNKGDAIKRAKLAGFALDIGDIKFGGGYTWNERNPALMRDETKGLIFGMAYGRDKWAFQASVLSSGSDIAGMNTGGDRYDSVMFGTSWQANDKRGYTASMQYQNKGEYDGAALFTIGTRFNF